MPPTTRDLLVSWCLVMGGIATASWLGTVEPTGLLRANLAGVAALLFVLVPDAFLRVRGEGWQGCGVPWWGAGDGRSWAAWGRGALAGLVASAVVLPLFAGALVLALGVAGRPVAFQPRLPPGFALAVLVQLVGVALPEELFYRGWMQSSWARHGPERRILGASIGPGFLATQALFAVGHLAAAPLVGAGPERLLTFFPGLLFGWLRARTGGIAAPVVAHALSNLLVLLLRASLLPG